MASIYMHRHDTRGEIRHEVSARFQGQGSLYIGETHIVLTLQECLETIGHLSQMVERIKDMSTEETES